MRRSLLEWDANTDFENYLYVGISVFLVMFSGLMSGLTLGLMSLDMTQVGFTSCVNSIVIASYATA